MKKVFSLLLAVLLISAVCVMPVSAAETYYTGNAYGVDYDKADTSMLAEGDRILLVGDSITAGSTKGTYVSTSWYCQWNYYLLTRFPKLGIKTIDLAIGGMSTKDAARFQIKNVYPRQTFNKTIVYIGTNDCMAGYDRDSLVNDYKTVLDFMHERNAEVIACITPVGYAGTYTPDLPVTVTTHDTDAMIDFSKYLRDTLAPKYNIPVAYQIEDFQNTFKAFYDAKGKSLYQDGIHPCATGSSIAFATLIDALKLPGEVSNVTVDAAKGSLVKNSNCEVTDFVANKNGVSYTYNANALPFSTKATFVQEANEIMDYMEKFSRETVKVTGLKAGEYQLIVDGFLVDTVTADQLANGINLALFDTPMAKQAGKVATQMQKLTDDIRAMCNLDYCFLKGEQQFNGNEELTITMMEKLASTNADYKKWIDNGKWEGMQKGYEKLDTQWDALYELAQPTSHTIQLTAVDGSPVTPDDPVAPSGNLLPIIIAVVAVVVVAGVVVLVVLKKKKK